MAYLPRKNGGSGAFIVAGTLGLGAGVSFPTVTFSVPQVDVPASRALLKTIFYGDIDKVHAASERLSRLLAAAYNVGNEEGLQKTLIALQFLSAHVISDMRKEKTFLGWSELRKRIHVLEQNMNNNFIHAREDRGGTFVRAAFSNLFAITLGSVVILSVSRGHLFAGKGLARFKDLLSPWKVAKGLRKGLGSGKGYNVYRDFKDIVVLSSLPSLAGAAYYDMGGEFEFGNAKWGFKEEMTTLWRESEMIKELMSYDLGPPDSVSDANK